MYRLPHHLAVYAHQHWVDLWIVLQVCTTLGMLTGEQAQQLAGAGLTAYNHNLDTSPEYYSTITSSRKYQVRIWQEEISCTEGCSACARPLPRLPMRDN